MRKLVLQQTYTQYTTGRNDYGDLILTKGSTALCLFRDISQVQRNYNLREESNVTGIFWFDPSDPKSRGDVIGFNGQLYRIESVNESRARITDNTVHFYKCTVSFLRQIS